MSIAGTDVLEINRAYLWKREWESKGAEGGRKSKRNRWGLRSRGLQKMGLRGKRALCERKELSNWNRNIIASAHFSTLLLTCAQSVWYFPPVRLNIIKDPALVYTVINYVFSSENPWDQWSDCRGRDNFQYACHYNQFSAYWDFKLHLIKNHHR